MRGLGWGLIPAEPPGGPRPCPRGPDPRPDRTGGRQRAGRSAGGQGYRGGQAPPGPPPRPPAPPPPPALPANGGARRGHAPSAPGSPGRLLAAAGPRRRRLRLPGFAWRPTPRRWGSGRLRPPEFSPARGRPGASRPGRNVRGLPWLPGLLGGARRPAWPANGGPREATAPQPHGTLGAPSPRQVPGGAASEPRGSRGGGHPGGGPAAGFGLQSSPQRETGRGASRPGRNVRGLPWLPGLPGSARRPAAAGERWRRRGHAPSAPRGPGRLFAAARPRRGRLRLPGFAWRGTPRRWAGFRLRPPESSPGPGPAVPAAAGPRRDRRGREPEAEPRKTALDLPAAPETPPAPTAWPPPPPFVPGRRPREAAETAPAFHTGLACRCVSCRGGGGAARGLLGRRRRQEPWEGLRSSSRARGWDPSPRTRVWAARPSPPPTPPTLVAAALPPPGGRASLPEAVRGCPRLSEARAGRAWLSVLPEAKSSTCCKHYDMISPSLLFLCLMCGPRQLLFLACGPDPPKGGGNPRWARGPSWLSRGVASQLAVPPCPGLSLLSRPPGPFPPHGH